jgi:hypothetical protein
MRGNTNVREDSLKSYDQLVASGQLGAKQLAVARMVIDYGPGTANEIFLRASNDQSASKKENVQQNIHSRLNELRDEYGVVMELTHRKCKVTGRTAAVWMATHEIIIKPKSEKSKKQERMDALIYDFRNFMAAINVPYVHHKDLIEWLRANAR